jgi:hypothetical protein
MGFHRGPKIVTDGLVLHLDAANPKSYPGSGTTWSDLSGNGNDGTLVNGPTFDSGNAGSIVFDGVNDRGDLPLSIYNEFDINKYTLSVWVYVKSTTNTQVVITQEVTNVFIRALSLFIINGEFSFRCSDNNTQIFLDSESIENNTWYNCILTLDKDNKAEFKLNNKHQEEHIFTNPPTFSTQQIKIGNRNNSIPFEGNIALVRLYNRILTSEEVLQNYNATKSRFGL